MIDTVRDTMRIGKMDCMTGEQGQCRRFSAQGYRCIGDGATGRSNFDAAASAGDLISAAVINTLDAPVPTEPGAYLLIMEMSDPVPLEIHTLSTAALSAGRYAYAGSAWGPGGIRARVIRHLKADKKRHWHIDHLTAVAPPIEVTAFPGRNECDILAEILARPGASIPVPGFGSSDCRNCLAHLVQLA